MKKENRAGSRGAELQGHTEPPPVQDNEAFLAWLASVPDPEHRYNIATTAMTEHQEMVARLSAMRGDAVAAAAQDQPVSSLARRLGVSRQRAHQLIQEAKDRGRSPREKGDRDAREDKGK